MQGVFATGWAIVSTKKKCYNDAYNMMGNKQRVSNQILKGQLKAVAVYCQGHSFSLSVEYLNNNSDILRHTMATVAEVSLLVKYSLEREKFLEKIYKNIKSEDSEPLKMLKKLSTARWTGRAECLNENH